jgi:hypothetical protein
VFLVTNGAARAEGLLRQNSLNIKTMERKQIHHTDRPVLSDDKGNVDWESVTDTMTLSNRIRLVLYSDLTHSRIYNYDLKYYYHDYTPEEKQAINAFVARLCGMSVDTLLDDEYFSHFLDCHFGTREE